MIKKKITALLAGLLVAATVTGVMPVTAGAAQNPAVTVIVDGRKINCEPAPVIVNDRILVPMRSVFESLGYTVDWDDYRKLAKGRMAAPDGVSRSISLNTAFLSMSVWEIRPTISPVTGLNDRVEFIIPLDTLDEPIRNIDSRYMLPFGVIASALGCEVNWDGADKTATISTAGAGITPPVGWVEAIEKHYTKYAPEQLAARQSWLDEEAENQRILAGVAAPNVVSVGDNDNNEQKIVNQQGKQTYTIFSPNYNKTFEYTFKKPLLPADAPVVGTVPARILIDESILSTSYPDPQNQGQWVSNRKEAYSVCGSAVVGGCNWYAGGRFKEVYGIPFLCFDKFFGTDKYLDFADQYDEFLAIRDIYDVRDLSIVVYGKGSYNSGHVAFVEYVERDANGKPVNVYFTEANANNPTGEYRHGIDGAVQMLSITDFLNRTKPTLGYIVPNPDFYK